MHTVAEMDQLATSGALDGRIAAVGGFWTQEALPCAFLPHTPPVLGFCNGGNFADSAADLQSGNGRPAPVAVPETVGGGLLWQQAGPAGSPARVVVIVHAADGRSWQCAPSDRATCASNLIIDRVAWINDVQTTTDQPDSSDAPGGLKLTPDQAVAAAVQPGETVLVADPILATQLNDVDPRFIGMASGTVWYLRVMSGTPDADGVVSGRDVLVDDDTGAVIAALPVAVDAAYKPARVVLDVNLPDGTGAQFDFSITVSIPTVAAGSLDSSTPPLALPPSGYSVHAIVVPGSIQLHEPCDLPLRVDAGADVSYYADVSASGACAWKQGAAPFN